ncbi:helix-turn-helix transcriptional regulator [Plantactinospora sp. KLBMP9567]|uniref:helix-turn-helix transcriptional regulator n=1 Tax=Plantactinospora sp. KLBMP9567 TaxID=3085900 RepID=UPI0029817889|nr:LuxR C-terminal-related transcriptional regulator [Plantactinospora sp. KLBMP9567]MDW5329544.1 LuxR C-terminal-related transcriptional regulator [Plantactinospora sp. KLBMP9567]
MDLRVAVYVRKMVLRLGVEALLSAVPFVEGTHDCESWNRVEELARAGDIDALIVHESDAHALDDEALELVRRKAKVLVLLEDRHALKILSSGLLVDGLLMEDELTEASLTDALRRITAGEIPMPAVLTRELIERAGAPSPWPLRHRSAQNLTPREMETLGLLAEGLGNKQIARRLQISSHGAKRIVASVLLKLGSPNRTTAVVTAVQAGLITLDREQRPSA